MSDASDQLSENQHRRILGEQTVQASWNHSKRKTWWLSEIPSLSRLFRDEGGDFAEKPAFFAGQGWVQGIFIIETDHPSITDDQRLIVLHGREVHDSGCLQYVMSRPVLFYRSWQSRHWPGHQPTKIEIATSLRSSR